MHLFISIVTKIHDRRLSSFSLRRGLSPFTPLVEQGGNVNRRARLTRVGVCLGVDNVRRLICQSAGRVDPRTVVGQASRGPCPPQGRRRKGGQDHGGRKLRAARTRSPAQHRRRTPAPRARGSGPTLRADTTPVVSGSPPHAPLRNPQSVIPAKAGISRRFDRKEIPAFAGGMSRRSEKVSQSPGQARGGEATPHDLAAIG